MRVDDARADTKATALPLDDHAIFRLLRGDAECTQALDHHSDAV